MIILLSLNGVIFVKGAVILLTPLLLGLGLSIAAIRFKVVKDPLTESLEDSLPGLNCGSCGYAGCSGYAENLASRKEEDISKCKPGGPELPDILARLLGVENNNVAVRKVAYLHCGGDNTAALKDFKYKGVKDCNAAKLLYQGNKSCKYSCLGLGSCIEVCPVGAISFTNNGLVRVDREKCIGCEKCIAVCPSGVLKMIPYDAKYLVACNSRDIGKITKKNCSAGCIGCGICEKKFPGSGFVIENNLSSVNYDIKGVNQDEAALKCPVKCIIDVK